MSACLLGRDCRYDGRSKPASAVMVQVERWRAAGDEVVAVCPEELGGLGTPRPAAELRGGDGAAVWKGQARVQRVEDGQDVSAAFLRGAERAAQLGEGAVEAVLKARSPSCGCRVTEIDGEKRPGDGVFAALLRARGLRLRTDEEL
ncbi:MAG TPA: DUF523 domain-containing protein [Myxococcota bacterium]|nr:DUF523 domain-containing protein [Myxococcota bacterium]